MPRSAASTIARCPRGSARPPARCSARESEAGRALIAEVQSLGVELRLGATAWGIFDQRTVAIATQDRTEQISAETLVLAPGAYDRPVPFPGWTLPGVMTAGGAQNLMKGSAVLPGRRVLVAGSGPLLLVVAHALLEAGARVEAVCEAAPMRGLWRYAHRMLPHLDVVQQGYRLHREIVGRGRAVPDGPRDPPGARRWRGDRRRGLALRG